MKQNGFTLIELLAVIVILAIIALIATPMILGVIESAKKGAAENSATGYMNAVEQYYVKVMMENKELPKSINELNEVVEVKGTKPSRGSLSFGDQQEITGAILCIDHFYVEYSNGKAKVNTQKNCNEIEGLPNQPKLEANMIPVVYENGAWVKASNTNWYDYGNQQWANAVTVTEPNRETYLTAEVGTEIKMDDINLMLVWIPRYEYKIEGEFGKGGISKTSPGEIEVKFLSERNNIASEGYTVHPGFTFGSTELTGMWVGKFESSATEISNTVPDDNVTSKSIIIKPSVESWRNHRIATAFEATRKMELANNPYGFEQTGTTYNQDGSITGDSNQIDTHMTTNTEWSAIVYLSQSKYGKYGNQNYTGTNKEVYINNYSGYQTGCSAGSPSALGSDNCTYEYHIDKFGTGASTTGNIYGIYDMNGGAWEAVMGTYGLRSGNTSTYNSGFNGFLTDGSQYTAGISFPNTKYYDLYETDDRATACNNNLCYGDNTGEAIGWYSDYENFVSSAHPWFLRGGRSANHVNSGVFAVTSDGGGAGNNTSFRIVLSND